MALLSTLRYGSALGQAAGSGNYGGELHLCFTKLNPADLVQQGGQPTWATWHIADTYDLPNGKVTLNLNVVPDGGPPLTLVMVGAIGVLPTGGSAFGGQFIGQGAGSFAPNVPVTTLFHGSQTGTSTTGVKFTVGFELNVAWDGVSADCHGVWWTVWN